MDKEGRGEVGKGNEERGGKGNGGWDVKKINKCIYIQKLKEIKVFWKLKNK